jgi:hypothetical protein
MVSSKATTVASYLDSLPHDRHAALDAVLRVIRKNLPRGYEEGMLHGMIGWTIPLSVYPETYNGEPLVFAALASQKGHMALYLMCVYGDPKTQKWFVDAYRKSGKKLDMGKSCVRFKKLDELPLDVVGKVIARVTPDAYIKAYEAARKKAAGKGGARRAAAKTTKKPAKRKSS